MTHVQGRPRRRPARRNLPGSRRSELIVLLAFGVAGLAGIAMLVSYIVANQTQVFGVLLGISLGGIGVGMLVWVQELMWVPEATEDRHPLADPAAENELIEALGDEPGLTRRKLLIFALFGSLAGLVAAVIGPLFSLGPAPALMSAGWRKGSRIVGVDGKAVNKDDLEVGSIMTVFPDNAVGDPNSATILIRLPPTTQLPPKNAPSAPNGYIAFSKVCTHAGCPVGLYRASEQTLICPCHQSTFDVKKGAVPVFGPAVRPLPQLPIQLQADGTFVATGPFPDPIGPSEWDMYLSRGGK